MSQLTLFQRDSISDSLSDADFDFDGAYEYYTNVIIRSVQIRAKYYRDNGFPPPSVAPSDWEVFGAILARDKARRGSGADLLSHEVKSAINQRSFEYQYHRKHGLQKLDQDCQVTHLYVSYSSRYSYVHVRSIPGSTLTPMFDKWRAEFRTNYDNNLRQRFRRNIAFSDVVALGRTILTIQRKEIAFRLDVQ